MDLIIEKNLLTKACFGTDTCTALIFVHHLIFTYQVCNLLHRFSKDEALFSCRLLDNLNYNIPFTR